MRNLLDTDAFVVGMLVLMLGAYQLATDEDARAGLGDIASKLQAADQDEGMPDIEARRASIPNSESDQIASTASDVQSPIIAASAPSIIEPQRSVPRIESQRFVPRIESQRSVPRPPALVFATRTQTIYPRANATVETSWVTPGEPCDDPDCPSCLQAELGHFSYQYR